MGFHINVFRFQLLETNVNKKRTMCGISGIFIWLLELGDWEFYM